MVRRWDPWAIGLALSLLTLSAGRWAPREATAAAPPPSYARVGAPAPLGRLDPALAAAPGANPGPSPRCHYTYTVWNTALRQTVARVPVDKARAELSPGERGPLGCTPCEEDQVEVKLRADLSVTVCYRVAGAVARIFAEALSAGAPIESVVGYRPSMSRGDADADGRRTQLSLHAYGVAVDVNEAHNGLYGGCVRWGPSCQLIKGGPWDPRDPLSLSPSHPLVRAFKAAGFGWGGELEGLQKDFMHFSPTGG